MAMAVARALDGSTQPRHLALAGWAIGLGLGLCLGLLLGRAAVLAPLGPLFAYGALLAVFHSLEFATTAIFSPDKLSFDCGLRFFFGG
jgi:hypothetical protein